MNDFTTATAIAKDAVREALGDYKVHVVTATDAHDADADTVTVFVVATYVLTGEDLIEEEFMVDVTGEDAQIVSRIICLG